jgi:polyhydroxyalkanoate synthesis regulator phasin
MPQGPDWKQLLEAGMNVTELGRAQARQIVADLVAQGQLAQDRATSAVDEVIEMSRRRREELREFVQAEIRRQVSALGIATKDDLARLERRLAAAAPAPAKAARTTKATKATPPKKAAAKKTTARTATTRATASSGR